mgnify:CR=1 FL=1
MIFLHVYLLLTTIVCFSGNLAQSCLLICLDDAYFYCLYVHQTQYLMNISLKTISKYGYNTCNTLLATESINSCLILSYLPLGFLRSHIIMLSAQNEDITNQELLGEVTTTKSCLISSDLSQIFNPLISDILSLSDIN